jgi:hypothetical protein
MFVADQETAVVQQNRDSDHDKSYDSVITVPRNRLEALPVETALEQIEARIEAIEDELVSMTPLVMERARLLRARAALREAAGSD